MSGLDMFILTWLLPALVVALIFIRLSRDEGDCMENWDRESWFLFCVMVVVNPFVLLMYLMWGIGICMKFLIKERKLWGK